MDPQWTALQHSRPISAHSTFWLCIKRSMQPLMDQLNSQTLFGVLGAVQNVYLTCHVRQQQGGTHLAQCCLQVPIERQHSLYAIETSGSLFKHPYKLCKPCGKCQVLPGRVYCSASTSQHDFAWSVGICLCIVQIQLFQLAKARLCCVHKAAGTSQGPPACASSACGDAAASEDVCLPEPREERFLAPCGVDGECC